MLQHNVTLMQEHIFLTRQVATFEEQVEVLKGKVHTLTQQLNAYPRLRGGAQITNSGARNLLFLLGLLLGPEY